MDKKVEHLKKPNVRKVMMKKKLSIVEHRKRRKKKQGVREKMIPKNDDEPNATNTRKGKKVNYMQGSR